MQRSPIVLLAAISHMRYCKVHAMRFHLPRAMMMVGWRAFAIQLHYSLRLKIAASMSGVEGIRMHPPRHV